MKVVGGISHCRVNHCCQSVILTCPCFFAACSEPYLAEQSPSKKANKAYTTVTFHHAFVEVSVLDVHDTTLPK